MTTRIDINTSSEPITDHDSTSSRRASVSSPRLPHVTRLLLPPPGIQPRPNTMKKKKSTEDAESIPVNLIAGPVPALLRDLLATILDPAEISFPKLSKNHSILDVHAFFKLLHRLVVSAFLLLINIVPLILSPFHKSSTYSKPLFDGCNSGIERGLSELLSILTDLPISSRKYERLRSLADRLIDDNENDGFETIREVNRRVLSSIFARTVRRLETTVSQRGIVNSKGVLGEYRIGRALIAVYGVAEALLSLDRGEESNSAEKLAAELLWIVQKMAGIGRVEDAGLIWASASNLASISLSAESRVQGLLLKVSALLMKEAKAVGVSERWETVRKLLRTWLPLMCCVGSGAEQPVLSSGERAELVKVMEEAIFSMEMEQQESLMSIWLHYFSHNPNTDWPNLEDCYYKWFSSSRRLLLLR